MQMRGACGFGGVVPYILYVHVYMYIYIYVYVYVYVYVYIYTYAHIHIFGYPQVLSCGKRFLVSFLWPKECCQQSSCSLFGCFTQRAPARASAACYEPATGRQNFCRAAFAHTVNDNAKLQVGNCKDSDGKSTSSFRSTSCCVPDRGWILLVALFHVVCWALVGPNFVRQIALLVLSCYSVWHPSDSAVKEIIEVSQTRAWSCRVGYAVVLMMLWLCNQLWSDIDHIRRPATLVSNAVLLCKLFVIEKQHPTFWRFTFALKTKVVQHHMSPTTTCFGLWESFPCTCLGNLWTWTQVMKEAIRHQMAVRKAFTCQHAPGRSFGILQLCSLAFP